MAFPRQNGKGPSCFRRTAGSAETCTSPERIRGQGPTLPERGRVGSQGLRRGGGRLLLLLLLPVRSGRSRRRAKPCSFLRDRFGPQGHQLLQLRGRKLRQPAHAGPDHRLRHLFFRSIISSIFSSSASGPASTRGRRGAGATSPGPSRGWLDEVLSASHLVGLSLGQREAELPKRPRGRGGVLGRLLDEDVSILWWILSSQGRGAHALPA